MAGEMPTLVQGELFSPEQAEGTTRGYRGTVAAKVAGITYRQLDYWARKRIVEPSIKASHGSGSRRLYSFKDVVILAVLKRLLDAGVNLVNATNTVNYLERRTVGQLEHVTVVCDGDQVTECSGPDQVFALMQSGRAVFAISVDLTTGQLTPGLPERPIDELTAMRLRQRLEQQHEQRQRAA